MCPTTSTPVRDRWQVVHMPGPPDPNRVTKVGIVLCLALSNFGCSQYDCISCLLCVLLPLPCCWLLRLSSSIAAWQCCCCSVQFARRLLCLQRLCLISLCLSFSDTGVCGPQREHADGHVSALALFC